MRVFILISFEVNLLKYWICKWEVFVLQYKHVIGNVNMKNYYYYEELFIISVDFKQLWPHGF